MCHEGQVPKPLVHTAVPKRQGWLSCAHCLSLQAAQASSVGKNTGELEVFANDTTDTPQSVHGDS